MGSVMRLGVPTALSTDLVGKSTVPVNTSARHCNIRVRGCNELCSQVDVKEMATLYTLVELGNRRRGPDEVDGE
jgi:purine nucleoside phosphorylase